MNTATWSELRLTPLEMKSRWYTSRGKGPRPAHRATRSSPIRSARAGRDRARCCRTPRRATAPASGSATSRPMVPTIRAYTGAVASRRSRIRSSASPSSGREDERPRGSRPGRSDPLAVVQLVEEVRGDEGDRAVREVEDARRLVREDQTRRHDRIDPARYRAGDEEVQELLHASDLGPMSKRPVVPAGRDGPAGTTVRGTVGQPLYFSTGAQKYGTVTS